MQAVRVPDGSKRNFRGSVELGLQAPGAEDFAGFEEEPQKVVACSNAKVAPLSFEEGEGLFGVDLMLCAVDGERSRDLGVGVRL